MKVIEIKHVEDCFDGSLIKELFFDSDITKNMIFELAKNGNIQYFEKFTKPFFKVRLSGLYDLKGIEGNNSIRIHLKDPMKFSLEQFISLIELNF